MASTLEPTGSSPTTPLAKWFRSTFDALYTSSSPSSSSASSTSPDSQLSNLLSQTFTAGSEQYLNHEQVSLDELSKKMWEGNALLAGTTIDWRELIEVPGSPGPQPTNGEKEVSTALVPDTAYLLSK